MYRVKGCVIKIMVIRDFPLDGEIDIVFPKIRVRYFDET